MLGVVRFNTICKLCHSGFKKSKISSNPGRWILKNIRNANATYSFEPQMEISTTVIALKRRKTAEERKAPRIIEYPSKAKGEFVGVWRNITLRELAKVLNTNLAYVNSIFLDQIKDPDMPLDDLILIQQAIRRSGRRMITVARPTNEVKEFVDKDVYPRPPPLKSDLKPRPPVVTVMGHVDHGKTTLLDALRASNVVDQEFGGITQHIGAFTVMVGNMQSITFLDTPGHAAFSAMRERGANVTDIVVLVVAADDGVMEQTLESIRMARNANVPIIVAINKIDSPKANIERTKKMLMEVGIQIESMGGDVQAVPISALKKQNLNQLVETILLQADILAIGGDPTGLVEAVIIESKTHPHRGKQCSLVVQRGTLKKGDILVAGTAVGKVRSLRDADGKMLHQVVPGYPAEMDGWRELPPAGELVLQVETEKRAKEVINYREMQKEERRMEEEGKIIGEKQAEENKIYKDQLERKRKLGKFKLKREGPRKPEIVEDRSGIPVLSLIVRADVDGTLEAILDVLSTYNSAQCKLDIVSFGVGGITENDIELAELFNAIIYAFNVETVPSIKTSLDSAKVTIKSHNVIYKLIDDIKEEINERLPLVEFEDILGEAKVLQEFEINIGRKKVPVAGCKCTNGVLKKKAQYKLIRNGDVIYTGLLTSMKHLKDEADVIKTEMECGLQLSDSSVRYQKDDIIVCFEIKQLKQTTEWDPGF